MPLISAGGALHGLLKQFGVRVPFGLDGMFAATTTTRGGYHGSSGYGGHDDYGDGIGSVFGGEGMSTVGSLMKVARVFM